MAEKTLMDILKSMSEEQQQAVYAIVGEVLAHTGVGDNANDADEDDADEDEGETPEEVKHSIFSTARKDGSLKDSYLAHAENYGIEEIEELFPLDHMMNNKPAFLNNDVEWVNKLLGGVKKLPFSRVKMMFADISAETIRAKGYAKGDLKVEDVFGHMNRSIEPCTIYKKQKLDRDDIVDITDFDVVAWVKEVMRMKLEEEIARAILIGDGREPEDPNKIPEECIVPIMKDSELFTIVKAIDAGAESVPEAFFEANLRARKEYKGSGNLKLFTTNEFVCDMLMEKDKNGRRIYNGVSDICAALRVNEIVEVEEMSQATLNGKEVIGILVNPADYSVGADKGGKVAMFDDFDIDYNQQKYLIETRCSGGLTVPYSAIVITK